MSSLSSRLELIINTDADPFVTEDFAANSEILDDHPGIFICTSGTRPTWDVAQNGMSIFETDTNLIWHWDGSAWERLVPKGYVDGDEVTSDQSTSSTSYVTAIQVTASIAAGGRRHLIIVHAPGVFNSNGLTQCAVFQDAALLQEWYVQGWTGAEVEKYPRPIFAVIPDTPSAGSHDYTLQFRAVSGIGGSSTIQAEATKPISLDVVEV